MSRPRRLAQTGQAEIHSVWTMGKPVSSLKNRSSTTAPAGSVKVRSIRVDGDGPRVVRDAAMRSPNIRYVAGVDHLRALAAILIVLYHGEILFGAYNAGGDRNAGYLHTLNPLRSVISEGHTAVGLFMVLSGFIFTYGNRKSDIEWGGFLRNRCLRILPLMVALAVVGAYAFPKEVTLSGLAQHALLMSNLPGAAPMGPFNLMFWTIAVEFQFYLIFPFLLRFLREGGLRYAVGLIGLALVF